MLGAAVSMACLLFVGLETNLWWIRVIIFLRGFAMGFCFVSSQAASYAEIAPADNGRASAIFSTQRQMSVSIGIALMATVLASFTTLTATPTDPRAGAHRVPLDVRPGDRPGADRGASWRSCTVRDSERRRPAMRARARLTIAQSGWPSPVTSIDR